MAAYATGEDLIARYDVDLVGDLATDGRESLEPSSVSTHPHVITALGDASGEVDVALLAGGRYTPAQLASLTGNSQNKLIRITCDIAMNLLLSRRAGEQFLALAEQVARYSRAHLQSLQRGENVFGLTEAITASNMVFETLSTAEIDDLNLLPSRMGRFFPNTQQRIPRR